MASKLRLKQAQSKLGLLTKSLVDLRGQGLGPGDKTYDNAKELLDSQTTKVNKLGGKATKVSTDKIDTALGKVRNEKLAQAKLPGYQEGVDLEGLEFKPSKRNIGDGKAFGSFEAEDYDERGIYDPFTNREGRQTLGANYLVDDIGMATGVYALVKYAGKKLLKTGVKKSGKILERTPAGQIVIAPGEAVTEGAAKAIKAGNEIGPLAATATATQGVVPMNSLLKRIIRFGIDSKKITELKKLGEEALRGVVKRAEGAAKGKDPAPGAAAAKRVLNKAIAKPAAKTKVATGGKGASKVEAPDRAATDPNRAAPQQPRLNRKGNATGKPTRAAQRLVKSDKPKPEGPGKSVAVRGKGSNVATATKSKTPVSRGTDAVAKLEGGPVATTTGRAIRAAEMAAKSRDPKSNTSVPIGGKTGSGSGRVNRAEQLGGPKTGRTSGDKPGVLVKSKQLQAQTSQALASADDATEKLLAKLEKEKKSPPKPMPRPTGKRGKSKKAGFAGEDAQIAKAKYDKAQRGRDYEKPMKKVDSSPRKNEKELDAGSNEPPKKKGKWAQDKRTFDTPFGKITVDSTDDGMWGEGKTSEDAADLNKGGSVKKTYGMRKGGFTNRGGMYS